HVSMQASLLCWANISMFILCCDMTHWSAMALTQVSSNKCAGGFQKVYEHDSSELKCKMKFAIYLPPKAETDKCPVFYWLSGLTCTEQNFITKAGSQLAAAEHGIIIVAPDTSPRRTTHTTSSGTL
ncbi:hypothetical protein XENORESO_002603, partial [Xenotaenia resolanae]